MSTIVFNRDTLLWSGTDRDKLPYEVDIKNVNPEGLSKQVPYKGTREKVDADGKPLYVLPQRPVERIDEKQDTIETTEVTANPITILSKKKVPLLDGKNKPITYQPTVRIQVTEQTNSPVLEDVPNEDGEGTTQVQAKNEEGKLLYWKDVPNGPVLTCYTLKDVETQKTDADGKPLYFKQVTVRTPITEELPLLEITADDERYVQGLPRVIEKYEDLRTALFSTEPELFTYEEVVAHKEKQITKGTFYAKGTLFETMEDLFDASAEGNNVDIGFDLISIPAGGSATTVELLLPEASRLVTIKSEASSEGLTITMGPSLDAMKTPSKIGEIIVEKAIGSVFVKFENKTNKRIDVYAFGLLV